MTNAQFSQPGANWRTFAALGLAVALEFAALCLAGFRQPEDIPLTNGLLPPPPIEATVTSVPPEMSPPAESPPPVLLFTDPVPEFTLVEPAAPSQKLSRATAVAHRAPLSNARGTIVTAAHIRLTNAPRPPYPYEARRAHQTGNGTFLLSFDPNGVVRDVAIIQSTGSSTLDQISTRTFRRWRCQPGAYDQVCVPVTFTLTWAQL